MTNTVHIIVYASCFSLFFSLFVPSDSCISRSHAAGAHFQLLSLLLHLLLVFFMGGVHSHLHSAVLTVHSHLLTSELGWCFASSGGFFSLAFGFSTQKEEGKKKKSGSCRLIVIK